jgi:hypothetical protein
MAMILGVVLFDSWMFAEGARPSDAEIGAWIVAHSFKAIQRPGG